MEIFEVVIAMLLCGVGLAALARHVGAPYPALVALAGAALAFVPGLPTLILDPELALALFVAPVLIDAAFDASPRDLRSHWRQVASLALGAVALTIVAVAVVARWLVPELPWAAAIAMGAIVAPPDAAAATTVLKQLRPPHRLLVILEGESLFNDASALLVYRLAVGAMVTGTLSGWTVVPTLLGVTVGSAILGLVLVPLFFALTVRVDDMATSVVLQFGGSFGVWLLAEHLHLSGIITTVVFAMASSRKAGGLMPARLRIPSWAVWEVVVFVLNVLAFILVGFQLKSIVGRIAGEVLIQYAVVAAVVCAVVIVTRIAWVTVTSAWSRWRSDALCAEGEPPLDGLGLTAQSAAVVGWCGMRGTVTLAAALALPAGLDRTAPFPYRDLILVTAFGVVLGTLVLQGLTLRPLILHMGMKDDGSVEREVNRGRVEAVRAGLQVVEAFPAQDNSAHVLNSYRLQLRRAEDEVAKDAGLGSPATTVAVATAARVIAAATAAQRQRLLSLRDDGTIGDAAFQRLQEELDWSEQGWAQMLPTEESRSR